MSWTPGFTVPYPNPSDDVNQDGVGGGGGGTVAVGPSQVVVKTGTYAAAAGDVVLADASGGAWALTLPAATAGRWVTVKKTDASANAVTVTPASGTVDGAATYPISTQWTSRDFVSDGTNWYIL